MLGSIEDGLTDQYTQLATKAVLDGFASIALAAALGWGVGIAAVTVLVVQGAITLGAGAFDSVLKGETLDVLTSAGGILIIGISLKLLDVKDVKVGNFLPALVLTPVIVEVGGAVLMRAMVGYWLRWWPRWRRRRESRVAVWGLRQRTLSLGA